MRRRFEVVLRAAATVCLLAAAAIADDSTAPGIKVQLAVAPQVGERFAFQSDVVAGLSMQSDTEIVAEMHQFMTVNVGAVSIDGTAMLREQIARVWGKVSMAPAMEMAFDSGGSKAGVTAANSHAGRAMSAGSFASWMRAPTDHALAAAIVKQIVVRIDRDGTTWVRRDDVDAVPGIERLGDVAGLGALPARPIGVGDSWSTDDDLRLPAVKLHGNFRIVVKHTVLAIDAESVTVGKEGSVRPADPGVDEALSAAMAAPTSVRVTKSLVKGTRTVSRKDGLTLSADLDVSMDVSTEFEPNSPRAMTLMGFHARMKSHDERRPARPVETPGPGGK